LSLIFFARSGDPLSRKMDMRLYAASPATEASFTAYGKQIIMLFQLAILQLGTKEASSYLRIL